MAKELTKKTTAKKTTTKKTETKKTPVKKATKAAPKQTTVKGNADDVEISYQEKIEKLKLLNKIGLVTDDELNKSLNKPLINIEGLHINFKRGGKLFEAVKNVNLTINNGEILGLVGESGSGKTTLGRATISLWDHALGKVEIDGREVPNKRIRSVSGSNKWVYESGQMIFQDPTSSLNRQSKVMDIVAEGMDNFDTMKKEYKALIEKDVNELNNLTKLFEILDTGEMKAYRQNIAAIEVKVHKADIEIALANDELKDAKAELKAISKEGNKKEIKAAEKKVEEKQFDLSECKVAKKEIEKEITNINKELEAIYNDLSKDPEVIGKYKEYIFKKSRREFIVDLIMNSKDEKILEMAKDHARESEIREEIEALWKRSKSLSHVSHKNISIIKNRISSEKKILAEEGENDIKNFKDDMRHEIEEFKLLQERNKEKQFDDDKVVETLKRRIQRFYVNATKSKSELPSDLKSIFPKDTEDHKKIKEVINKLDSAIKSKSKLSDDQKYYAESLIITLNLILKKREKVVTPINTIAFDHNYLFLNNVFVKRVHYLETLLKDLDVRIELEHSKQENIDESETILIDFYKHSIEYLDEYREILTSYINETKQVSLKFNQELLNHDDSIESIKKFYKWAIQQSKINDELKVSIATWKAEKAIEYSKRSIAKDDRLIILELEDLQHEGDIITSKYEHILNPKKELSVLIKEDVDKFEEGFKISPADYKKELKNIPVIEKRIEELKDRINENNRILKDKKLLNEKKVEKIKETLLKVGLNDDALNKYPDQFSGGQKQRIGIARTIINNPKFIIADEPISALDVSVQAQVVNLLKDINEEMGLTMLFIAHDLQMVHYISDRIAVIYRGNIVEYGDADKIYKSPRHPYTKSLIGAMPSLSEIGKKLEVSNYSWSQHEYNEFSIIKMHEVEEGHFVYGTEAEIKKWK